MICFANDITAPLVRAMWKTCFGDDEGFLDIYFTYKYSNHTTLIYMEGEEVVASLQMLPYSIPFYGTEIPFAYLSGLCTLPAYRKKGYMEQLIHRAHHIMIERHIPLSVLIPGEEWLYQFYAKYDYVQVFEKKEKIIPLRHILTAYPLLHDAYTAFDALYRTSDFCVQKTYADFEAIVLEYTHEGCPPKTNVSGMARIVDVPYLLSLYAEKNPSIELALTLQGDEQTPTTYYHINHGLVTTLAKELSHTMTLDRSLLCRLLFGYKIYELDDFYLPYFAEHSTTMNLMLE